MYNDKSKLSSKGLKITPQRVAVMDALSSLVSHPTAESIITYIRRKHPNIAPGTVYKTLEVFVNKGIIKKVMTDEGITRYDHILENHHHLYCSQTGEITDYIDEDLDNLLSEYFKRKKIAGFNVKGITLQVTGDRKRINRSKQNKPQTKNNS